MVDKSKKGVPTTFTLKQESDGSVPIATLKGPAHLFKQADQSSPTPTAKKKKKSPAEVARDLGVLANIDRYISQGHTRQEAMERVSRNLSLGNKWDIQHARQYVLGLAPIEQSSPDGPEGRPAPMAPLLVAKAKAASFNPLVANSAAGLPSPRIMRDPITGLMRRTTPDDFPSPIQGSLDLSSQ